MKQIINLTNVSLSINNKSILNNINLSICNNITAIIGHNGAGKTSLLKVLSKIYAPSRGSIIFAKEFKTNKTSFLFQNSIFLNRTVKENLLHCMMVNNYDKTTRLEKIVRLMKEFNVYHLIDSNPQDISSGERQLISFVRGLLIDPQIYFLDEPFNNLDNANTDIIYSKMHELSKCVKIIFITHSQNDISALDPEIIKLKNGTIDNG